MPGRAIVVGDGGRGQLQAADWLSSEGWWVSTVDGCDISAAFKQQCADVVFLDVAVLEDGNLDVLERCVLEHPGPSTILIGDTRQREAAVEAMRLGAFHFLTRPFGPADTCHWAEKALRFSVAKDQAIPVRLKFSSKERTGQIVCRSPKMMMLRKVLLRAAAAPNGTILILGETGVGKEIVARALHQLSPRKGPFVAISCPAVPESLFESELFGHERGAFTGAGRIKRGLVEEANGGTLFLDEIGDMPPGTQVKLLRVLQERVIRRVGGTQDLPVDVRVVTATNRDLRRAVRDGRFRQDLFYRLMVIPIQVPPLRQRFEDILPLARTFLLDSCRGLNLSVPHLSSHVENALLAHRWPGNVRELQNWAERTALLGLAATPEELLSDIGEFGMATLESEALGRECPESDPIGRNAPSAGTSITLSLRTFSFEDAERALVERALERAGGDKNKAAKLLGINRATLYRKLAKFRPATGLAQACKEVRPRAEQRVS